MKKHANESGVALLLALGVMSLLLAMALGFVSNAVIARNAAANNSGRSQAVYFARTAANRLLADLMLTLKNAEDGITPDVLSHLVSRYRSGEEGNDTPNNAGLKDKLGYSGGTDLPTPQWVYIHEKTTANGKPDTGSPIIGRYAYMARPAGSAVSLSEALRGQPELGYERNWGKRYGVDMKELDLREMEGIKDHEEEHLKNAAEARFKNEQHAYPQKLNGDYQDYEVFFSRYAIGSDAQTTIRNYFAMGGRTEPECYPRGTWDEEKNSFKDGTEYYHRFNLARNDWNDGFGKGANSNAAVEQLLGYTPGDALKFEFNKNAVDENNGKVLQFLRMIGDDKAAYEKLETRRKQIAANLIDYCDDDDVPTSDVAPESWDTTAPKYTGNEKTPYLNEVAVHFNAVASLDKLTDVEGVPPKFSVGVTVSHEGNAEIFDLYEKTIDKDYKVKMKGSVDLSVQVDGEVMENVTLPFNYDLTASTAGDDHYWYGSITSSEGYESPKKVIEAASPSVVVSLTNLKVDIMILSAGGKNVDCTRALIAPSDETPATISLTPPIDDEDEAGIALGFSVDDPRENLYQGQKGNYNWEYVRSKKLVAGVKPDEYEGDGANSPTFGKQNTNCKPAAAGDKEAFGSGDRLLSTAWISNMPMKSPLELGAIARGAKWETINLKAPPSDGTAVQYSKSEKYDPAVNINDPGTTYAEGDAGILDQIKMTPATYDCAKINLNEDTKELFKALVSGVTVTGATAEIPAPDGATQDNNDLANAISNLHGDASSVSMPTRASLLQQKSIADIINNGDKDMEKEALFAKTACLMTTTRQALPGEIRFMLIAQAITDVGGVKVSKVPDNDTEPVSMDTKEGTMDYYKSATGEYLCFDDIRGEVKMLLTLKYDPAAMKFRIDRMETMN